MMLPQCVYNQFSLKNLLKFVLVIVEEHLWVSY